jgi:hypothetical protein
MIEIIGNVSLSVHSRNKEQGKRNEMGRCTGTSIHGHKCTGTSIQEQVYRNRCTGTGVAIAIELAKILR